MKTSIYVLVDPRDGDVRYVGLTTTSLSMRLKSHISCKKDSHHRARWIQLLLSLKMKPIIRLVQETSVQDGPLAEIYWIKFHKEIGCKLVNSTNGGEAPNGYVFTEEDRAKMRSAQLGRKHSPETLRKLTLAKLNQSTETRAKIGEANRKRIQLQTTREKIANAHKGKHLSKEHKEKLRVTSTGRILSDEAKRKISDKAKERWKMKRSILTDA